MVLPVSPSLWFVVVGLVVAAGGTLILAAYTIRYTDGDAPHQAFTVLLALLFVWTAGESGRLLASTLGRKLVWHSVLYVGVFGVPVAWLVFSLLYTGYDRYVRRETVGVLLALPLVNLLALYTNSTHQLFYGTTWLSYVGATPVFRSTAGPLWWLHFGYSYLLVGLGIVLLVRFAVTAEDLYRAQATALVVAALVPLGANALFVFGGPFDPVLDITPLAFALSSLLLFVTIFYGRFLDLVPVAHERVVRTLEDGILVVDADGQILSANAAAASMLADEPDADVLVGDDLSAVEPTLGISPDEGGSSSGPGVSRGLEAASVTDGAVEWFWIRRVDLTAGTTERGSVVTVTDITDKKRFERQLRKLQRTNQRLIVADDDERIATIAAEAAKDVLGLSITGVWKHDSNRSVLEPVTMTDEASEVLDGQPTFEPGESLAWQAFEAGELRTYTDLSERTDIYNPQTPLQAEILVPIGDWGVMASGSTTETEFREVDFELLRVLAGAVENALARAEREQTLRRRERELERQNERLEQFTDVVSHDLRSPLNQVDVYLDMLATDIDDDRIEAAADANDRATEMVTDLLALARQGKTVEDGETKPLEPTVRNAWRSIPARRAELTVEDDLGVVAADHGRLREAFENLFRNSVEHGSTGNRPSETTDDSVEHDGDAVRIRVGRLDDRAGIYVADDGPGVPDHLREEVFDHGYTTEDHGTGFGLAIVERIVEAHGWQVRVTESAAGGARFDIFGMASLSEPPGTVN